MTFPSASKTQNPVTLQMTPTSFMDLKKLTTMETIVNTELKLVSNWLRLKLSLNATKTELVIFRSKWRKLDRDVIIKLNGIRLIPTDSVVKA